MRELLVDCESDCYSQTSAHAWIGLRRLASPCGMDVGRSTSHVILPGRGARTSNDPFGAIHGLAARPKRRGSPECSNHRPGITGFRALDPRPSADALAPE